MDFYNFIGFSLVFVYFHIKNKNAPPNLIWVLMWPKVDIIDIFNVV